MNRYIKYSLVALAIGLVAYKSVYIKKLSEMKEATDEKFDAVAFSKKLWEEKLPVKLDSAIAFTDFIRSVQQDPAGALSKYSNVLGIGNFRYALVKLNADVADIKEDEILVLTFLPHVDSVLSLRVATEFIYGNAIRDASALVDVKDFPNTIDLNNISEELNKRVRQTVVPPFKEKVKKGDKINVIGAIEINKEHLRWNGLEIIPVRLQILQ
jgi:predicted lipoprotein